MPVKVSISSADSLGILECQGSVALASLLQQIAASTRARIVGSTSFNTGGIATVVLAGGLAEVQHAVDTVKSSPGITNSAFFAKPDLAAMKLLLASLNIATETKEKEERSSPRVREVRELDVTEMELWNVHELRRYARNVANLPIQGRQISRANRQELLNILRPHVAGSSNPMAYPTGDQRPN